MGGQFTARTGTPSDAGGCILSEGDALFYAPEDAKKDG